MSLRVIILVACLTGDRKGTAANTSSTAERLLHYPLEITALIGFISWKHVFVLRNRVFWVVTLCVCVISSRRTGFWVPELTHSPDEEETSGRNCPRTRRNPEHLVPKQLCSGNLKWLFSHGKEYISLWLFYLPRLLCFVDAWLYERMKL